MQYSLIDDLIWKNQGKTLQIKSPLRQGNKKTRCACPKGGCYFFDDGHGLLWITSRTMHAAEA
jgi:hypothetical protein